MLKDKSQYAYQPLFCEENIWQLAHRIKDDFEIPLLVLFFINARNRVLMFQQSSFGPMQEGCWDYHVVLCLPQERLIVDFDSALGFECGLREYFDGSFPEPELLDHSLRPTIRSINGKDYLAFFSSDRSHMIDRNGRRLAPFPTWSAIRCKSNPLRLGDLRDTRFADQRIRDQTLTDFLKDVSE